MTAQTFLMNNGEKKSPYIASNAVKLQTDASIHGTDSKANKPIF
jgi:hypothetical protein